jgi:hypothetical protein
MKYIKIYDDINWNWLDEEENDDEYININNIDSDNFHKLKINDKIKINILNKELKGKIIYIGKNITIEFDEYINGHDGNGKGVGKKGHCWIYSYKNNNDVKWLYNRLKEINFF